VYLRALGLALRERGDDEGFNSEEAFAEYNKALNDAIAYEQRRRYENTHDGDWHIVTNGF
jgi:ubiquinone biosynthesis protein Coq4